MRIARSVKGCEDKWNYSSNYVLHLHHLHHLPPYISWIRIPSRSTRAYKLFNEPRARVNTVQSSLFCRLPRVANSFLNKCNRVDVFNDTFHAFKRAVIRYVNEL